MEFNILYKEVERYLTNNEGNIQFRYKTAMLEKGVINFLTTEEVKLLGIKDRTSVYMDIEPTSTNSTT